MEANTWCVVYLVRTDIPRSNGVSGPASTTICGLGITEDVTIIDFKFLDDTFLLVLCNRNGMLRDHDEKA